MCIGIVYVQVRAVHPLPPAVSVVIKILWYACVEAYLVIMYACE